jgi:hypothetical protein
VTVSLSEAGRLLQQHLTHIPSCMADLTRHVNVEGEQTILSYLHTLINDLGDVKPDRPTNK